MKFSNFSKNWLFCYKLCNICFQFIGTEESGFSRFDSPYDASYTIVEFDVISQLEKITFVEFVDVYM